MTVSPRGERDDELAARREVAAGRDESVALEQRERVVDGASLDDAVQIEPQAGRPADEEAGEPDLSPATCGESRLEGARLDLRKRAVVARRVERGGNRGVAEAVGRRRGAQRVVEGGREEGGDDDRLGRRAVEALEVGVGAEAAQRRLERGEEALDRGALGERGATDDDLAAHRPEAVRAHEVWVEAWAGWTTATSWDGATEPEPKNELLACDASWLIRDERARVPPPRWRRAVAVGARRVGAAADDHARGRRSRPRPRPPRRP